MTTDCQFDYHDDFTLDLGLLNKDETPVDQSYVEIRNLPNEKIVVRNGNAENPRYETTNTKQIMTKI
jgi:hypothetical protein